MFDSGPPSGQGRASTPDHGIVVVSVQLRGGLRKRCPEFAERERKKELGKLYGSSGARLPRVRVKRSRSWTSASIHHLFWLIRYSLRLRPRTCKEKFGIAAQRVGFSEVSHTGRADLNPIHGRRSRKPPGDDQKSSAFPAV